MKFLSNLLLICAVAVLGGCGKGKTPENPPASAPVPTAEPVILKQDIETLHKAEALDQAAKDSALQQHQQIDAATQ